MVVRVGGVCGWVVIFLLTQIFFSSQNSREKFLRGQNTAVPSFSASPSCSASTPALSLATIREEEEKKEINEEKKTKNQDKEPNNEKKAKRERRLKKKRHIKEEGGKGEEEEKKKEKKLVYLMGAGELSDGCLWMKGAIDEALEGYEIEPNAALVQKLSDVKVRVVVGI